MTVTFQTRKQGLGSLEQQEYSITTVEASPKGCAWIDLICARLPSVERICWSTWHDYECRFGPRAFASTVCAYSCILDKREVCFGIPIALRPVLFAPYLQPVSLIKLCLDVVTPHRYLLAVLASSSLHFLLEAKIRPWKCTAVRSSLLSYLSS